MDFTRNAGESPPPASILWFAIPACTVVAALAISLLVAQDDSQASSASGTSYDASKSGFRALYLILDELGYDIERTRRVAGGAVRWALAPLKPKANDAVHVVNWVQKGGRLLLADGTGDLATALGLEVNVDDAAPTDLLPTTMDDVKQLAPGKVIVVPAKDDGRLWAGAGGDPLISIHQVGQGEVWLLQRPLALANEQMRQADNAIFAARLAEAMSDGKPGNIRVDEYCHGLRSRPGVLELMFQPPMRTVAIQAIIFAVLMLWSAAVRFYPLRPLPKARRRSKEEFLNAMGDLLHRHGDTAAAFRTIQGDVNRKLAERIGLPANTHPDTLVEIASRRRPMSNETRELLTRAAPPTGRTGFVNSIQKLDEVEHELTRR